jgi:hypothetical protein
MCRAFADGESEANSLPGVDRRPKTFPEWAVRLSDPSTGGEVRKLCPNLEDVPCIYIYNYISEWATFRQKEYS